MSETIENNEKILGIITEKIERVLKEIVCDQLYYLTPAKTDYDNFVESDINTTDFKKYVLNMLMDQIGKIEMDEKIIYRNGEFMMYHTGICELNLEPETDDKNKKGSNNEKSNKNKEGSNNEKLGKWVKFLLTVSTVGFGASKLYEYVRGAGKEKINY